MTAADLIELLSGVDPDTEVRIAEQPRWPFEYSIEDVVEVKMGADRAEEFGARNGVPGELLVRVRIDKVLAEKGVAD